MDNSNKKRNGVCRQQQQQDSKRDSTANPRQWPNNARRRESKVGQEGGQQQLRNAGSNNNTSAGHQQHRNNNDKRSRWNRNYNATSVRSTGGEEATGLADPDTDEEETYMDMAEWDSVLVPGSKKHNLNHLLNFHYAPREMGDPRERRAVGNKKGHQRNNNKPGPIYNKDQFLQANCNFIVRDSGCYKSHWNNPDTLVDWKMIEEVVIRSSEEPKCPICLFPPVAAKMTKCGHVYCFPCILHYLALSDKEWRKCPICFDAVRLQDLRSTSSWPYHEYQMNETVDFQLMCRRKGFLGVTKVGKEHREDPASFPHLFDVREQQIVHSKLILANNREVMSILDRERCELQDQMRTDGPEGLNCPETMFISQAIDLLEERTKAAQVQAETTGSENTFALYDELPPGVATDAESEFHYFYQAVDGQHLYMNSFNLRMLQAQFGTLANCPPVLTGRIVQRELFSVSDVLRKRSKYLQHLPLTTIITIVEVNFLGEDVLFSAEVREQFAQEVNQRTKDRQRRARDEKKREKHINDLHERQMGKLISQSAGFVREETSYPPFLTPEGVGAEMGASGSLESEMAGSPSQNIPFSFAKMLQCTSEIEKAQPSLWPTLNKKKTTTTTIADTDPISGATRATKDKVKLSKMDKHFPNLLDTIDIETEDGSNDSYDGAVLAEEVAACSASNWKLDKGVKYAAAAAGPKGNNNSSSKRTPKKQQLLLFSTDMNFNRN